jgi:hypothetical protein
MTRPTALITGASGGIGEALAYAFARGGYDLLLVARSGAQLAAVADRARTLGAEARCHPADLQRPEAIQSLHEHVASEGFPLEALVNNAGYGLAGAFLSESRDDQLGEIDLNVRALTDLSHRFGTMMKARGRGGVLNVASTAAFQPGPYMAVYYATKAYVLSFTEALNQELRGSGVHATALCPGPVETGFQARAAFDNSMRLLKVAAPMSAEAVARAGFEGFARRRAVVIPGASNAVMARAAPFTPRPVLLSMVEALQKKRLQA